MKSTAHKSKEIQRAFKPKEESFNQITNPLRKLEVIQVAIEKNCEVHFGIRAGLLSDDLVKAVISEISNRYGSLSVKNLDFAFDNYAEERKDWKMITKKDVLNPVDIWFQKREAIKNDHDKHKRELEAQAEGERKRKEFEDQALFLYNQGIKGGEWKGNIFHASTIAKKFLADKFPQDVKDKLWDQAQKDHRRIRIEADKKAEEDPVNLQISPEALGMSALRIYSNLIVKKAINQKIIIQ